MMDIERNVSEFMKTILYKYSEIRGKDNLESNEFWDAVIISASDDSQMKGYKRQITEKQSKKEIPLGIPFHIFSDPPGYKIGCGGSTMYVLEKISQIYGSALHNMRILLVPAGGYSQRLPNLTALGKLFCPLPFGNENYQMLDLILATYLPFLKDMPPGVFLASSDAIISYSLKENDKWTFNNEGFTALAHPSPISVGCGHGVYVLPPIEDQTSSTVFMSECLRVLQKPSIEEMHEKGAVTNFKSGDGDDGVIFSDDGVIFSDSTFFFDHSIVIKLIKFYNSHKPLKHELSSYGDFLQPLGSNASPSYIVEKETNEELATQKSALYRNLYGTNLSILVLKHSFFHHLGSMQEYIDSFCFKNKFSDVFPVSKLNFSSWSANGVIPLYIDGTILHSIIHPMLYVPETSLVEYCDINVIVSIGKNCIISNIRLHGFPVQRLPYEIPDDTLIHTAAVQGGYVTIACNINDDIKKAYESRHTFKMDFFGKYLKCYLATDLNTFPYACKNFSLWNAEIFPIKDTPEESLIETLKIVNCKSDDEMRHIYYNLDEECIKFISIGDILLLKDTEKMIDYQQELYCKINRKLHT